MWAPAAPPIEKRMPTGATAGAALATVAVVGIIGGLLRYPRRLARNEATRRELERELRRSSRYVELSHDLVCTAGFDGFFKQLNAAWTQTLGWSEAELRSRPVVELVHPDDREVTERESALLARGGATVDFVNRYATREGGWRSIEWQATAIVEEGLIYAVARDVTHREASEDALRARERETRQACEELIERQRRQLVAVQTVGRFGSWEWDIAAGTIEWSEELCRIYGVQAGCQRSFEEFLALVHPDDRAQMRKTVQTACETHRPYSLEHRIVRSDGAIRVLRARGEVVADDGGRVSRMLGVGQDVTAEKAAEETRARAALVEYSEDAIIAETLDGMIESWNRGAQALFGYSAEEAVGEPIAMLVGPDRQDELAAMLAQIKRGERVDALETVRIAKDGRAIDVSLRISLVYDAGELVGASSISRDITRQKLLEAQLRRSSRYFYLARDLTITAGFDGYFKSVNPALEHILGWSREEFLARPFIDMVHPDDRAATLREVAGLGDGNVTFSLVNRFLTKNGSYRWLDWNAMVPPDEPLMYASARDITERTQMETALREAEQRFRTAFDRAPIGVCLLSLDPRDPGRLLQVNPALAELLGSSVEQLTGTPVGSLAHPDDRDDVYGRLGELTDGDGGAVAFEKRLMHRNGHPVWALISAAPLADDDGERRRAVTHVMDISDRKQAETKLQHLADHDALTGLFNRRRFTEELERTLRHAKRFGRPAPSCSSTSTASSSSTTPSGTPPATT
jgi:PAS domain S-box-containing protein